MLSEDANSQKAIEREYHDASTIISNCTLKRKAKPTPEKYPKQNQTQKNKNHLKKKKIVGSIFLIYIKTPLLKSFIFNEYLAKWKSFNNKGFCTYKDKDKLDLYENLDQGKIRKHPQATITNK